MSHESKLLSSIESVDGFPSAYASKHSGQRKPLNRHAYALGMDLGTSALRIVAISESGETIDHCHIEIEAGQRAGQTGIQDPSSWWLATQAALRELGQRVDFQQIRGLAIDATSGTVLAVDHRGRPLSGGRMYNDTALPSTVKALARILPENSAAHGATSPLARMIEMQGSGVHKIIHQADWLTGQFSGRFDISDENNALKSGFDSISRTWPTWVGDTQMDPQLLPQVVPTGTDLGRILPEVASLFGFSNNLRIVSGTTDGCASFIASGACDLGDAVTSLGTTLTLKQLCAKPISAPKYGVYSHRLADFWLCGGASNSGGAVLLHYFSREQIKVLESRLVPECPTALNYYPLPSIGERFPHANVLFEPRLQPRPLDDARFLQGLLEGIASVEKVGYSRLQELGAPALRRVFTVGGGARNKPWQLIRERLLGVTIGVGFADAAFGSALIALSALKQTPLFSPHLRDQTA